MSSGSRFGPVLRLVVAACVVAMCVREQASAQPLPIGRDALPGGSHVATASTAPTWAASLGLGYAHTEAVPGSSAVHERASAEAGLAWSLNRSFMVGATGFARYDAHRTEGERADEGAAFGSRLSARMRGSLRPDLDLGGELNLTFPPANGIARGLQATSPSLRGIVSYAFLPTSALSLNLGGRLDRSRQAVADPARLSADDRIAAGLSNSHALLFGVLATTRLDRTLLGVEWSWDLLVGADAPAVGASPMRLEGFAQHMLYEHWFVGARIGASPSARPAANELAPIEARVWTVLSIGYLVPVAAPAPKPTPPPAPVVVEAKPEPPAAEPTPAEPALPPGQIRGRVRSLRGAPIRARVEVVPLGQTLSTDDKGAFVIDVPPGRYSVVVRAEGYEEQERPAEVEQNGVTILVIDLRRAKP